LRLGRRDGSYSIGSGKGTGALARKEQDTATTAVCTAYRGASCDAQRRESKRHARLRLARIASDTSPPKRQVGSENLPMIGRRQERTGIGAIDESREPCPIWADELARSTIATILERNGIEPAPERRRKTTWKEFLTQHWEIIVASDFFAVEVWTRRGLQRFVVLRQIPGNVAHPQSLRCPCDPSDLYLLCRQVDEEQGDTTHQPAVPVSTWRFSGRPYSERFCWARSMASSRPRLAPHAQGYRTPSAVLGSVIS
jgi:hypothetical protein